VLSSEVRRFLCVLVEGAEIVLSCNRIKFSHAVSSCRRAERRRGIRSLAAGLTIAIPVSGMLGLFPATASAQPGIAEYPVPTSSAGLQSIAAGPDGNVWFNETSANKIAKITPSGAVTEYTIPTSNAVAFGIAGGSDGNIWFTEARANKIGKITPAGAITEYTISGRPVGPEYITAGPDGNMWFTEDGGNAIGRITPSGTITQYVVPTAGAGPNGITTGPNGNLWFTEVGANQIGEITPSGVVTEFPIPTANSEPISIATGSDGNLWFTESEADQIGEITTSGVVTEYPVPTQDAGPYSIAAGPDGNLWFTEGGYAGSDPNQIGEITTSGTITEYPVPTADAGPAFIAAGPDGNMWFTESKANQIGQVVLATAPAAPTNLTAASPTTQPALTWDSVSGATSYNIYRDGTNIGSSTANSFTDTTASVGTYDYYVTAVNSSGESPPSNTVTVMVGSPPAITSADSATTGMRTPFTFTVTTSGTPVPSLSESGQLPGGITFVDNGNGTGTISGVANTGTTGSYPIVITASNGLGTDATQSFTLTVNTSSSPPAITSANSDTETVGAPFSFTVTTDGYPAPALSISKHNGLPADITFTDNGDGSATIASSGPAVSDVGSYAFIITASNGVLPQASQTFTLTITEAPVLKNIPATKTASVGQAFTMNITSKGNPIASLTETGSLPAGLTFTDNGNGTATISGTPQPGDGGAYSITITATNQLGSTSQTFTLKVDEAPAITSDDTASANVGSAFSFTVTATGYPAPSIKKTGALPKGLTWSGSTDTISGTPAAGSAGSYPLTFTAKNSSGSVSQTFTLTVS
jgi:streptogramin lyase